MTDSTQCKICNKQYSRKCDLMRHVIKYHDHECLNYNMYYIKYITGIHPTCNICGINPVEVRCDKIDSRCRICAKIEHNNLLSKLATDRLANPTNKEKTMAARESTTMRKYGVSHVSKLEDIKQKKSNTAFNNFGVRSCTAIPSVKSAREKAFLNNADEINEKRSTSWTPDKIQVANIKRRETNNAVYGVDVPTQTDEIKEKLRISAISRYSDPVYKQKCINNLLVKYGVTNVSQIPAIKQLIVNTSLTKYNSTHYLASEMRRLHEENAGRWIPLQLISDFENYHRRCVIETKKHTKDLYRAWDGKCAYTGCVLLTDKSKYNDPLYRTIDHKISIYNGFIDNVDPATIGGLDNLCICSREANSRKGIN